MLRFLSIRGRLQFLSLLLIASLIGTNLLLIDQTRRQGKLISQQAAQIDLIVQADAAVHSFGNLKYWLTDLAVSQLILSEMKAKGALEKLNLQLAELTRRLPDALVGVPEQVEQLVQDATKATAAYEDGNRLVGNAMMARGRSHILAVDSKLSALVAQVHETALQAARGGLARIGEGVRISLLLVGLVTLATAFLTFMIVRSVVGPLKQLSGVMNAMTGGQIDVTIPTAGRDEISAMARVLTLFRDSVVRRDKAERAEARLLEAIENLSEGFVLFDADDRLVQSNRGYRTLLQKHKSTDRVEEIYKPGTTFEAIISANAKGGMILDAVDRVEDWVAERLAQHRSPSGPITQERRDGTWVQINEHVTADGGRVALYTDISELKQRERELHHQGMILQQLYDAVIVVDLDNKIVDWNTAAERTFGYTKSEMLGRETRQLYLSDADAEAYSAEMAEAMARDGRWVGECTNRRKDGSLVRLEAVVFRLYDAHGQAVSTIGVNRDITERKRVEIDLRRAKEQAELATRAKSQFLANMSHELRTPLNAIIGFSRLVKRQGQEVLPQRQIDNLGKILISADHLLSLINSVLDLSKIEAGQMALYNEPVALGPLIEDCLRTVEPMTAGKPIALSQELAPDLPELVTDGEKLKQILINLLSNAVKFTDRGEVVVRVQRAGQGIAIAVADTGIGIPKAEQGRVFEEFHQADGGPTRRHGGTGLGLSISRHLAQLMGGDITLESAPGDGATFTLSLATGGEGGHGVG